MYIKNLTKGHRVRKTFRKTERTTGAEDTQNQHYQRVRTVVDRWHMNKKKTGSVTDSTALTLCRGTVPTCRRVARSAKSDFSPFNVYIPVRSNVNNGSECAPLNFVMASADISIVRTPSRSTHCSAHKLFNDWQFQSGFSVILS